MIPRRHIVARRVVAKIPRRAIIKALAAAARAAILSTIMAFGYDISALRATLGIRNFAVFTAGNSFSLIGSWVQRVAVGWLTWELTHSPVWLGAVSMAEFLPAVVLGPFIGVLADRLDRRAIAVWGQVFAALQAIALAVFTLTGSITPLLILTLQIAIGMMQPLMQTARLVLVPTMVPRANVGTAIAVTSLTFNTSRVVGPAVAGAVIATFGVGYGFVVNAASYVFVIAALLSLKLPPHQPPERTGGSLFAGFWGEFTEGWRYTFSHPTIKWAILMITASATLTWPTTDLLAGIADRQFDRAVVGLAALASAQGIGAIVGSLFLAQRQSTAGTTKVLAWALLLNGFTLVVFAFTQIFWLAVIIFAVNGTFLVVGGAGSQTVVQAAAAERMRGRTLSIWFTLTRLGPALGALGLGALADAFGFTGPLAAAGALAAIVVLIGWRGQHERAGAS